VVLVLRAVQSPAIRVLAWLSLAVLLPACGTENSLPSPLELDMWVVGEDAVAGDTLASDTDTTDQPADTPDATTETTPPLVVTSPDAGDTPNTTPDNQPDQGGDTPDPQVGGPASPADPDLEVRPDFLDFGSNQTSASLLVRNGGGGELAFEVLHSSSWVTLNGATGTSTGQECTVDVRISRDDLTPGTHTTLLTVHSDVEDIAVELRAVVEAPPAEPDASPVLYVNVDELDFGETAFLRTFDVRNSGGGTLHYTIETDVNWATVSPTTGDNTGQYDRIDVSVDHGEIPPGTYAGNVTVTSDDNQTHRLTVRMTVPAPALPLPAALELNTQTLDFGAQGWTRAFDVRNAGEGTLTYTVTSDVDWLSVEPAQGEVTTEPQSIEVLFDREPLVVGAHEAVLTVQTDDGQTETVAVNVEKPVTGPLIVPWLEVNLANSAEIEHCVQGLLHWRRVTHTAMVTTTRGRSFLYPILLEQVPDMEIIPGIKTASTLGYNNFDSLAGWQILAQQVTLMAEAAGQSRVLLENETALWEYWFGDGEIDLEQLRVCLSYLPDDIQIIWYPAVHSRVAEIQQKSAELCELVEDVLDCRFVDTSFAHPIWPEHDQWWIQNRQTLEALAEQPTMPITYFGQFGEVTYWDYDEVQQILTYLDGRPDVLFYPGASRWDEAATSINTELWGPASR